MVERALNLRIQLVFASVSAFTSTSFTSEASVSARDDLCEDVGELNVDGNILFADAGQVRRSFRAGATDIICNTRSGLG
jgi:hypothetical protein